MKPPIQRFLSTAGSQGEFDSEGVFTIDGQAAAGKLADFQLPSPTAWTLKIVQAAVRSGAEAVEISQHRGFTEFSFLPTETLDIDELARQLTASTVKEDSAIGDLSTGLRAVGIGQGRNFALSIQLGREHHVIHWHDGALRRRASLSKNDQSLVRLEVEHLPRGPSRTRALLEENQALAFACQACPIEVACDRIRLDTLAAYQPGERGKRLPLAVIWRSPEGDSLPSLPFPEGLKVVPRGWRPTDLLTDQRTFILDGPKKVEDVAFLARLSFFYQEEDPVAIQGPSFVHWIRGGVVVESERIEIEPCATRLELFLNASHLRTDLSGLALLRTEEKRRHKSWAVPRAARTFENTIQALDEHKDRPSFDLSSLGLGAFITFHGLFMALGFKGLTLPFHLFIGRHIYKGMKEEKRKLRESLQKSVQQLRTQLTLFKPSQEDPDVS